MRLLFDVIHCKSQIIERAVQFAVSNCLVCDTTDAARHVAYELNPNVKHNVRKSMKLYICSLFSFTCKLWVLKLFLHVEIHNCQQ